jgi:EGF-like domain
MMKFTLAIALGIAMGAPAFAQTATPPTGTNACSSGPCKNNGICSITPSTSTGYTCTCMPGYSGVTCGNVLPAPK